MQCADVQAGVASVLSAGSVPALLYKLLVTLLCPQVADFGLARWTGEDGKTALTDTVTNLLPAFYLLLNILCWPQVADFGLAQWTGEDGETALTDTVTNRLWLAPEVLHSPEQTGNGNFVVSKAADVYSFGCIMHEVLTGRLPFESESIKGQVLEVVSALKLMLLSVTSVCEQQSLHNEGKSTNLHICCCSAVVNARRQTSTRLAASCMRR
jgi:serine/threonine protein kinase